MASDRYFLHHGILLPTVVHNEESLKYANDFKVQDSDVFAITYPKSECFGICAQIAQKECTSLPLY
ncbi:unnamed protein product [Oncorhynchus mykiss]|uniref:Uncharacterized protein n=1 Tax=Oncorhynchus mykiss TaxID=8022 RepID=A0A060XUY0_ONCMY|nr:unnamed protein product [Oncorhynchus mykiss]